MSELPEGWIYTLLSDVAPWRSGGTPSRNNPVYYGGSIPWIKIGELGQGVITDTKEKITELGLQNSSAKLFPKGSVAVAMYGATIGKTAILGIEAATNQACAVGIPIEGLNRFTGNNLRTKTSATASMHPKPNALPRAKFTSTTSLDAK
ncbi:hypothetical protein HJG54_03050 [Leptolyngbya sp. NK1-12]|uniref:Type I restriction modification DNA specificity domain-containing protein n=1 Tax=Leptolyngbya sp. NK1-12 TaxID=2547451 RepID=A0AA96WBD5_9CYAN|nr:hypothetical protein HJG54_03050 [Leptolyngbya sp. NK1-12]